MILVSAKVHIIHVGNMANKGTEALLKSDVTLIRGIAGKSVSVSVSTTDIEGVKRLGIGLDAVLPAAVDIPYERVDVYAKRAGYSRGSTRYKLLALVFLFSTPIQVVLSLSSVVMAKIGLKPFYRGDLFLRMKDCNVVVSYSDENFKETASLLPVNVYWILTWWSMLFSRTWEVVIAKLFRKPVVMFPNSVGPFRTPIGRFLSKLALNRCDFVLVREPISYGIVKSLGIRSNILLTSDTVVTFGLSDERAPLVWGDRALGVSPGIYANSVSDEQVASYVKAHAALLDYAIEKYGVFVIFLPHYVTGFKNDDLEISKRIAAEMRFAKRTRLIVAESVEEFRDLISKTRILVSSKMHPIVLAATVHVPTLCVAYDHKQTGFLTSLGMANCIVTIDKVCYESLSSTLDYVWNNHGELKNLLQSRLPLLQRQVVQSISTAVGPFLSVEDNIVQGQSSGVEVDD